MFNDVGVVCSTYAINVALRSLLRITFYDRGISRPLSGHFVMHATAGFI